jgi:hypothetical protein
MNCESPVSKLSLLLYISYRHALYTSSLTNLENLEAATSVLHKGTSAIELKVLGHCLLYHQTRTRDYHHHHARQRSIVVGPSTKEAPHSSPTQSGSSAASWFLSSAQQRPPALLRWSEARWEHHGLLCGSTVRRGRFRHWPAVEGHRF